MRTFGAVYERANALPAVTAPHCSYKDWRLREKPQLETLKNSLALLRKTDLRLAAREKIEAEKAAKRDEAKAASALANDKGAKAKLAMLGCVALSAEMCVTFCNPCAGAEESAEEMSMEGFGRAIKGRMDTMTAEQDAADAAKLQGEQIAGAFKELKPVIASRPTADGRPAAGGAMKQPLVTVAAAQAFIAARSQDADWSDTAAQTGVKALDSKGAEGLAKLGAASGVISGAASSEGYDGYLAKVLRTRCKAMHKKKPRPWLEKAAWAVAAALIGICLWLILSFAASSTPEQQDDWLSVSVLSVFIDIFNGGVHASAKAALITRRRRGASSKDAAGTAAGKQPPGAGAVRDSRSSIANPMCDSSEAKVDSMDAGALRRATADGQWSESVDPASGNSYYTNATTGETTWTPPPGHGTGRV